MLIKVAFQAPTVASMKMAVFGVVARFSQVEFHQRACCLHHEDNARKQKITLFQTNVLSRFVRTLF